MADYRYLGKPRPLVEGAEKVTGHVRYTADLVLPRLIYARPILSPYAHARLLGFDLEEAAAAPGVVAVLTAADLPLSDRPATSRNSAVLARDRVLWRGQPVAVVVAESEAQAADAAERVRVHYEPLPAVTDLEAALAPEAPLVWPDGPPGEESDLTAVHTDEQAGGAERQASNVHTENRYERGNTAAGMAEADVVVERTYTTSMLHQAYLEPHACVADPDALGRGLTLYTSTQGPFLVRDEVARILALPAAAVRVVPMAFGGGFGAKYGILEPLAGAVALALRRPVRLVLTRSEDFLATTPAQATRITLRTGARRDGRLTALEAHVVLDNGAFAFRLGGIVSALLGGTYRWPHVRIDVQEVHTHKPQIGAYRAPGAPQAIFAVEGNVAEMAAALGLDPLEFRLRNASREGDHSGTGRVWPAIGMVDVLERARAHPLWQERARCPPGEGIGLAVGGWPGATEPATAICRVDGAGIVTIQVGAVDISGVNSSFVLVAAEILSVRPDQVRLVTGDTDAGPHGPASGGSQVTYSVAGAVRQAAEAVREKVLRVAAEQFEADPADLELVDGHITVRGVPQRTISLGELARHAERRRGGPGPIAGEASVAQPESAPGFVAQLAHVRVDRETGRVQPLKMVTIQDVGFALNPLMVQGQIHGGTAQALGMALSEALVYDADGQLLTGSFLDYPLPRADSTPALEVELVEVPSAHGPFGARGVGEPPITAGAAALADAVWAAAGVRLTALPMTAEAIWRALSETT